MESLQFTEYWPGGYYKMHTDWTGGSSYGNRKLSFSLNVTDPNNYKGGDLHVYPNRPGDEKFYRDRGWITFFPSFVQHQALDVIEGNRKVLIGWIAGPTFK